MTSGEGRGQASVSRQRKSEHRTRSSPPLAVARPSPRGRAVSMLRIPRGLAYLAAADRAAGRFGPKQADPSRPELDVVLGHDSDQIGGFLWRHQSRARPFGPLACNAFYCLVAPFSHAEHRAILVPPCVSRFGPWMRCGHNWQPADNPCNAREDSDTVTASVTDHHDDSSVAYWDTSVHDRRGNDRFSGLHPTGTDHDC